MTDTGRARVFFNDRNQSTNDPSLVGNQICLQAFDPVAGEWVPQFRGVIDNITADVRGNASPRFPVSGVQFDCVDIFDYLAGVRFLADGTFGDAVSGGSVVYAFGPADDRANDLLENAGLDSSMKVVFTLNVDVNETLYDNSDNVLAALRDVCDAEFPGIGNAYVDKRGGPDGTGGRVAVHGRFARFDPDGTAAGATAGAWDFTRWTAATRGDVGTTNAHIREFTYSYPRARIINSYLAYPREDEAGVTFDKSLIPTLEKQDAGSIAAYGYRGRTAPDLIIREHKTNGNTGADECELFGEFYVNNYSEPRRNIETVTFKSVWPHEQFAAATWQTMLGMDISDILNVTVGEAGVGAEDYYVEGIQMSVRAANKHFDLVQVTPNLSPSAYYTDNVFDD